MKKRKGFVLPMMVFILVLLMLIVPVMITWVRDDNKLSVKDQKTSIAFNLAEGALARGYWKVKSSTATYESIRSGATPDGYRFDVSYADPGGAYRIYIASGPVADQVTIIGEGRDFNNREVRAIKAVYLNTSIPGAVMSAGNVTPSDTSVINWGPVMAMGNITMSGTALQRYYPRKMSKQSVIGNATYPRDLNGVTPPNTDGIEWWSDYDVPELPQFDFATMRASAAANGTLNCGTATGSWDSGTRVYTGLKPETANNFTLPCCSTCTGVCTTAVCKIGNIYADRRYNRGLIWYWDEGKTVTLYNTGVKGTFIVRGSLVIEADDCYGPDYGTNDSGHWCGRGTWTAGPGNITVKVPPNAHDEYRKLSKTTFDTNSTDQYPGDLGLSSSSLTYLIGSSASEVTAGATGGDIGFYGFIYTGQDFTNNLASDVYGAVWVGGNVLGTGNTNIFYDATLKLPLLNVILIKQSWEEIKPTSVAWP